MRIVEMTLVMVENAEESPVKVTTRTMKIK